jgi:dUTP pyrophosphatase
MTTLPYKIIRHPGPAISAPAYKTDGASGMDLHALEGTVIRPGATVRIPLGFAIELPAGFEAQIRPRSNLSAQGILCHFGTIDQDYRGELAAVLTNTRQDSGWPSKRPSYEVKAGDRIAQLVVAPVERVRIVRVEELSETGRGSGGFGSTGR